MSAQLSESQTITSVEALFDRLHMLVLGRHHWAPLETSEASAPGFQLSTCQGSSPGMCFLRVQYEMDVRYGDVVRACRPETFFHSRRPEFDDMILACGLEEVLAPGDAFAWCRVRMTPAAQRTSSLISGTAAYQGALHGRDPSSLDTLRVRMAVRRDYPAPGRCAVAVAPRHPESGELLEEWGVMKATAALLEASEDPEKTLLTQVRPLASVPDWAVALAAPRHFQRQFERMVNLVRQQPVQEVAGADSVYMPVALRKFVRGRPPLLPVVGSNGHCGLPVTFASTTWEETGADIGAKNLYCGCGSFARYLQAFFDRLGLADAAVYGSLDGRQLVPYQAAVERAAWPRLWSALEEPFRVQRAAYRHLYGGRRAPELVVDAEPRFLAPVGTISGQEEDDTNHRWSVRNTFVHFDGASALVATRLRAGTDVMLA